METIQCCLGYCTWIIVKSEPCSNMPCVCVCVCCGKLYNNCYVRNLCHAAKLWMYRNQNTSHMSSFICDVCERKRTVSVKHRFSPVYMTWNNSLAASRRGARDWWIACKDLHNTCSLRSGLPLHGRTTSGLSVYRITALELQLVKINLSCIFRQKIQSSLHPTYLF